MKGRKEGRKKASKQGKKEGRMKDEGKKGGRNQEREEGRKETIMKCDSYIHKECSSGIIIPRGNSCQGASVLTETFQPETA